VGALLWFIGTRARVWAVASVLITAGTAIAHLTVPGAWQLSTLAVSEYKGVSYARAFPDNKREYNAESPFGHIEVYSSSYLHFAPGLSDNAALNLTSMPENAYLGLYVDGDGPIGVMRDLNASERAYFRYLPMIYPYLITKAPRVFVVQFGGGISTMVALGSQPSSVTVAESSPALLSAFRTDGILKRFTNDVLGRVTVIPYDGRLYLAKTDQRYDVVDLSLADSAGLSNPGGFAIVEKYAYTQEAMQHYMSALTDQGVLSATLWNKEEPPKSVLRLYATMAGAARANGDTDISQHFFVASSYLSTTTVLYKRSGFTAADLATLRKHTAAMSFDEIYSPGLKVDVAKDDHVFADFENSVFGNADPGATAGSDPTIGDASTPTDTDTLVPAARLSRIAWQMLIRNDWQTFENRYVFDVRPITNARPYFAAYVHPTDLPKTLDRLELFQDEWGYLLLWLTLGFAAIAGVLVMAIPIVVGWRTAFSRYPGKAQTILYFACLGFGYITVEVGLTAQFVQTLSNATVSASVLITGMLVSSGLGSLVSERFGDRARVTLPRVAAAIGVWLIVYSLALNSILSAIGGWPYALRLICCFLLIAPPAFLMGFPMATGMGMLTRLKKEGMFLWAWGVNGCFSVVGAALVPIIATAFGLTVVIASAGAAYLLAIPAFWGVLKPPRASA
jgi:hypothetical protein